MGGWSAVGEGESAGMEEAVRPVDQARPKCKGCLATRAGHDLATKPPPEGLRTYDP